METTAMQKAQDEGEAAYIYSAAEYYDREGSELKGYLPYTYIMHKYIDIALDYMGQWSIGLVGMDINSKIQMFETYCEYYLDPEREFYDLEATDEDAFFSKLYDELSVELNDFPVIAEYVALNNVVDPEDIILPFEGGFGYSKMEILYCVENNLSLEHERYNTEDYYEEDECGYYSANAADETSSSPQRLIASNYVSKWLTDIRYRNYKESCPDMNAMREAMDEWEAAMGYAIRFVEIKDNGWNRFTWSIGCNYHVCISDNASGSTLGVSSIGAVPWAFVHINPDQYNIKGTCLHELGHTLTLEHEQCRPDRDCYINVHFENMEYTDKIQFHKFLETSVMTYGSFDFESIMLYDSYAASKNGDPTMTKKNGSTFIGQRWHLSEGDIQHIRYIYY